MGKRGRVLVPDQCQPPLPADKGQWKAEWGAVGLSTP